MNNSFTFVTGVTKKSIFQFLEPGRGGDVRLGLYLNLDIEKRESCNFLL